MGRSFKIAVAAFFLAASIPSMALATTMEYYCYGSFDPIVSAFKLIATIFGTNSYQALFYTVIISASVFAGLAAVAKITSGGQGSILGWTVPMAIGIAIFIAFFIPKGSLQVYDQVLNKAALVSNIPNGIVLVAGTFNTIERGLVEIVSNAGDAGSFQTQAGGTGFLGLYSLTTKPLTPKDSTYLEQNLNQYIEDCVTFAVSNQNSGLTIDELRRTPSSLSASLAKAKNPAIFTKYFSAQAVDGDSMTCSDSWAAIIGDLTPDNLSGNIESACTELGYDTADAQQLGQCRQAIFDAQDSVGLGGVSLDAFVTQQYLKSRLDSVYRSGNTAGATNYQFLTNISGSMKSFNDYYPMLRGVLTAVSLALIPILVIFLPTPMSGKVGAIIFGFFIWLTTWGVVDSILHGFAMSYANKVYDQVRNQGLGLDALYLFPSSTVKALAMFGTLRMSGLVLSTALTGMLVRFGGHAITQMGSSLQGHIGAAGGIGASRTEDVVGNAQAIKSVTEAAPVAHWANIPFNMRAAAAGASLEFGTGGGLALGREGFRQGYKSTQVTMGTTDAFAKSGDPRSSAALGTSLVKAPTGQLSTNAGQEWIRYASPDGKIVSLSNGQQKLSFSNDMITDASGMHLGIKYIEGIKSAYSEARVQAEAQTEKFDMMTGKNFMSSLTNSSGSTSMEAISKKYSVSQGTAHELNKSLLNTASIIGSKANSIKDEHGNSVSKDAYASFVAEASAGTPFGKIAPISVSGTATGAYRVSGTTKDGTAHSFTVDVADRKGVEKTVGETWRDTSSSLRSTDLSSNDQKAIGEMMQVSSTESTTTQAGAAWSRARSLDKRESEEVAHSLSSSQNYDTALIKQYGDRKYTDMPPQERYTNAASDLNSMAVRGDKESINKVFGEFMTERALAPEMSNVRGDHALIQAPTGSPVSLDNTAEKIGGAHGRIEAAQDRIPEPTSVPTNIRGTISVAHPTAGLKSPDPQLRRYLNLMNENVEGSGKEMERITASTFGPLAQSAPLAPLVAPTARGAAAGRYPGNNITDFDPKVAADALKSGAPILFPGKHQDMSAGIKEGAEKIFLRAGIAKPGMSQRMNIGGN